MSTEPPPRLLHEVFARAVMRHAARTAVDVPPSLARPRRQVRSYADLDNDAGGVAAALGGERGERVVAILLPRATPWLYAAQLGVLRAGAAYVGLDPRFPDEHLRFVVADAGADFVLTDAAGAARMRSLVESHVRVLDVATLSGGRPAGTPDDHAPPPADPDDRRLAYVVYTSGTTGRPKGVMIEHRSVTALVLGDAREFALGPGDRVAQGSSPAYDSAVEEVWLALAAGATVVPMDDEVVRRGPDLVPWLRDERITVLCPPPTLLAMTGCADPAAALPELRLLYVGGEALPQELADRWARGRRMVNGYGPTECTVTVTRAEVVPGQPVTIGDAVPGNRALVLDAELGEVSDGTWGELCLTGVGVARGYLGRPELTAERFVQHPTHGRLYRTGDRVRRGDDGALRYDGRLDAQVKLRGHRVELGEIEARIADMPGVRAAACAVQRGEVLVAFVVGVAPDQPPDCARILARLRAEVPAHMVPSRCAVVEALPTTVGGKLDRRALPELPTAAAGPADGAAGGEGCGPLEERIAAAWRAVLGVPHVARDADFFALGGDSVRAAMLVSRLRDEAATAALAVADVYSAPTVATLAALAQASAGRPVAERAIAAPVGARPLAISAAQTAWLLAELLGGAALLYATMFAALPLLAAVIPPALLWVLSPLLFTALRLLTAPMLLTLAVAAKRLLIGRYVAGRAPVWSWWYLRHWLLLRIVRLAPWGTLEGTELQCVALRMLGARIGRRVHIDRGVDLLSGGWDLLQIGDGAALGRDAALGLCELDDGHVVVGPVTIGHDAVLEVRAGIEAGASVGTGARVTALSLVPAGARLCAGRRGDGVPAVPAGDVDDAPRVDVGGSALGPWSHAIALIVARWLAAWPTWLPLLLLGGALLVAFGVDGPALIDWLAAPRIDAQGLAVALAALVTAVPASLLGQALGLRFGPRVPAGVLRTRSALHVLVVLRSRMVEGAGAWLSGTLFWPLWLRLAGARIGSQCEISTILDVLPEHLSVGARSFLADGIYLGGPRCDRGTITVLPTHLGQGTFLGNHVVIPAGATMPDDLLLGVCTVGDPARQRPGTSWFGHPAFVLPRREVVTADRSLTFAPGPVRVLTRLFWEGLRFSLPVVPALSLLAWIGLVAASTATGWRLWCVVAPTATLVVAAALAGLVLALKWLLLGRVRPGSHALWSCWCSRWDFLYVAWGQLARPVLARLGGTLWLGWYLRAMGMRIGRRVVLGPGFAQVVDPDMLTFGDGATIDTMFQAHSFEDRVLKIDRVTIAAGATLRRASVVLYGAEIAAGCRVGAHSVVMKNEHLLPRRHYVGVPTRSQEA